ncbi:MAG: PEP-CTERM sorting domain-containing protein [Planctomycetota bacterium]
MKFVVCLFFVGSIILAGNSTQAAFVSSFERTTNDGVFTLTPQQAADLGSPTADRIGFFRIRDNRDGDNFEPGDTFDQTSILASVTSNAGAIIDILNGENAGLTYTGEFYESLGVTTIGASDSFFRGVAFTFNSSSGNIVFRGSSTFDPGTTSGAFVPIPEPASLTLLAAGALCLTRRRKV